MSVVIPTWNGAALLDHALNALERQTWRDFEVLVVDNGSTDGTVEMLGRDHPDVRVVALAENRGFAGAVNVGIRASEGEIVALLNNDTEAHPGWLEALVDAFERHPEVGSCASKMLDFHDRTRIDSAGDQLGIVASQMGHGMPDGPAFAESRYVLSACAGAAAYRRSLFDDVGLFDERYFAYFEDVDFGVRSRLAGYRCLYVPDAVVYHVGSATSRKTSSMSLYLRMRNTFFLFFHFMPMRRLVPWAPLVFAWPFVCALREGHPLRLGWRAVKDFLRQAPATLRRRRELLAARRISWAELRADLAPPLTRSRAIRRGLPTTTDATDRADRPVDVIIVNWNGRAYLPDCLEALGRSTAPVRVLVVDNASDDDSVAYVRSAHPWVEVVPLERNTGYAAGANEGLRRAGGPFAVVMNPDALLAPDHLEHLRRALEADGSIGIAQGKLYRIPPEAFAIDEVRREGPLDSAGHAIRRSRRVLDRGQGRDDAPELSRPASVFSACGAAIFLRRAMWEDVAPDGEVFDEAFFAYKEEIDLCWRARWLGWDVAYVPDAVGWHVRAWAGDGIPPKERISAFARRHSWKNHYLLMVKNDRLTHLLLGLPSVLAWECARHGYALLRDPAVYRSYLDLARLLPEALRRRRALFLRRRASPGDMRAWFGSEPRPLRLERRSIEPSSAPPPSEAR